MSVKVFFISSSFLYSEAKNLYYNSLRLLAIFEVKLLLKNSHTGTKGHTHEEETRTKRLLEWKRSTRLAMKGGKRYIKWRSSCSDVIIYVTMWLALCKWTVWIRHKERKEWTVLVYGRYVRFVHLRNNWTVVETRKWSYAVCVWMFVCTRNQAWHW